MRTISCLHLNWSWLSPHLVRRLLLQVLELGVGDEDEAGGLEAIEGEEAGGVDLVPQFKHADDVAEAELTLARILSL
jgi:hypothetical protein